jgi:hypothetical protein
MLKLLNQVAKLLAQVVTELAAVKASNDAVIASNAALQADVKKLLDALNADPIEGIAIVPGTPTPRET